MEIDLGLTKCYCSYLSARGLFSLERAIDFLSDCKRERRAQAIQDTSLFPNLLFSDPVYIYHAKALLTGGIPDEYIVPVGSG